MGAHEPKQNSKSRILGKEGIRYSGKCKRFGWRYQEGSEWENGTAESCIFVGI